MPLSSPSSATRPRLAVGPNRAQRSDRPPGETQRPRFTIDGSTALETHLGTTCARIAAGLRGLIPAAKLEAVLLGGGYGRGEGGVLRTANGDAPYNDLEFYVCLRGNRHLNARRYGRALHVLGEILTPQAGVDVEFHLTSLRELAAANVSMFSYDLICGHRWLVGEERLLAGCSHHRAAEAIPLDEATRLLMNRCTGLLLAAEKLGQLHFTSTDADYVARNLAKAQLGAGDAVLTAHRQYRWSVRERHRRIESLPHSDFPTWLAPLCRHYAAGVEFKLHPTRSASSRETLTVEHAAIGQLCRDLWLWLESRRLGAEFRSIVDYTEHPAKCGGQRRRNLLINAKVLGPATLFRSRSLEHPRERILTALPLLLWCWNASDGALIRRLQQELRTTASDFTGLIAAYRSIWSQVN